MSVISTAIAVVIVCGLGFATAGPARGQTAPTCVVPARLALAFLADQPFYASHQQLSGEQAELAAAIYNSNPPATDDDWPVVIVIDHKDGSGAILVGRGEHVCGSLRIDADRWQAVKRGLFGTPA